MLAGDRGKIGGGDSWWSLAEELGARQRSSIEEIRSGGARWRRSYVLGLERDGGKKKRGRERHRMRRKR
jgi:hypothetical protein